MENEIIRNTINESWMWFGTKAEEIILVNEFGNIIFENQKKEIYRINPEELLIQKIADNYEEFYELKQNEEFITDWEMKSLVQKATEILGRLDEGQKYCFKIPTVIGGKYEIQNIGKIAFLELISVSGDLALQIKDLKDGTKVKLRILD